MPLSHLNVVHVKSMFFDRLAVIRATDKKTRRFLGKFGARVRLRDKGSIKSVKSKKSRPGKPPYNRTGLLKKFILYAYDQRHNSVVIGAAALNGRSEGNVRVPELLEHGGKVVRRRRLLHYRAFPHTQPAFEKEIQHYGDSIDRRFD